MSKFVTYLKLITPALLVIFILGAKPVKVKGQEPDKKEKKTYAIKIIKDEDGEKVVYDTTFTWVEKESLEDVFVELDIEDLEEKGMVMKVKETDDGHTYVYAFSTSDEEGGRKAKAIAKTICSEKDGVWTISSDEEGDMKLIVKKDKDGDSEADIYIITSKAKSDKKKDKKK